MVFKFKRAIQKDGPLFFFTHPTHVVAKRNTARPNDIKKAAAEATAAGLSYIVGLGSHNSHNDYFSNFAFAFSS